MARVVAAAKMINDAYDKGQEQRDQVRRDYELGKDRGQRDAQRAKQRAQQEHAARGGTQPAAGAPPRQDGGGNRER